MWAILLFTVATSAADSLNPIAITQQFVLQGMVKKPRHIWYYIIPTGVTNLIGGFLAYYGLFGFIGELAASMTGRYGRMLMIAELVLGVALLAGVVLLLQNKRICTLKDEIRALSPAEKPAADEEEKAAKKVRSVSPPALVALGVGATISELTTALPYFAFLAIIFNYQLSFWQLALILVVYNFIYTLPLMLLYVIYMRARSKFDRLYAVIKAQIERWADILGPVLTGAVGVLLAGHAAWGLL